MLYICVYNIHTPLFTHHRVVKTKIKYDKIDCSIIVKKVSWILEQEWWILRELLYLILRNFLPIDAQRAATNSLSVTFLVVSQIFCPLKQWSYK